MKSSSTMSAVVLCTALFGIQESLAVQGVSSAEAVGLHVPRQPGLTPSSREQPTDSSALMQSQLQAIAKDAYIYAYPMLFNYKTLYQQAVDTQSPAYVGGLGTFRHYSKLYGPKNREAVTPNNDTLYSWAWLDLRREPWVLSVPEVSKDRYYVFQGIDLFTYNFAYVGSRATGHHAGHYLYVGPAWNGKVPAGIDKVFKSDTDIVALYGRTGLDGPSDVKNVQDIQQKYQLVPLSEFEHQAPPAPVPAIKFPVWDEAQATSADFIPYLNFLLQFTQPVDPSEHELMQRFAKIGVGPGLSSALTAPGTPTRAAIARGVADARLALASTERKTVSSLGLFGSRAELKNNYMARAVGAGVGIYGNTETEAVYFGTPFDTDKHQLLGKYTYKLHFAKKDLPPAKFFWSMTMYDLPGHYLVANPINRYSIGDRTENIKYGADGSLDIYVQHAEPDGDKKANWLPAQSGPYFLITRIYGPQRAALDGTWQMVKPQKIDSK